jgi:hypothetical protein
LAKDWEDLNHKALAFVHLASIRLMLRKLSSRIMFRDRLEGITGRLGVSRLCAALALTVIAILAIARIEGGVAALTTSVAAQTRFGIDRPVDRLSIGRSVWHRGSGLLYGSMTLTNRNQYPVWKVIIACDLLDRSGQRVGTRASGIGRVFQVGRTRVSGIYFIASGYMQGGRCRVLSAERFPTSSIPMS